jgi:hypothetical protein
MNQGLKQNICHLPPYAMNDEVEDLLDRRGKYIGEALEYACTSWAQHLSQASGSTEPLATVLGLMNDFMQYHFLSWLEVLSIADTLHTAVHSLQDVRTWLNQVRLLLLFILPCSYARRSELLVAC